MDKYEYKLRAEEIKNLISQKEYAEAMAIADTIDWRRVKNISMLTVVSDLYKINRKYDVSRDMLLLAYDRHPGGRTIVYSLCELSIKLGEFVQAVEYYKEFVRVAPNDSGRFILKYKIYDAQEVSLEERIHVLEEFKAADYREKWGYELAFLYHRAGLERQCVAECDEIIITFGEGKYVVKAMELKMLHQPLTPVQQEMYDNRNGKKGSGAQKSRQQPAAARGNAAKQQDAGAPGGELDIHVKTLDMGNKYNTLNIQEALANSMKEIMAKDALDAEAQRKQAEAEYRKAEAQRRQAEEQYRLEEEQRRQAEEQYKLEEEQRRQAEEQYKFEEEQRRLAEVEMRRRAAEAQRLALEREKLAIERERLALEQERLAMQAASQKRETDSSEEMKEITFGKEQPLAFDPNMDAESLVRDMAERAAMTAESYDHILSMENDGQISLVVPEQSRVEKQITGQLSIEEVLKEWERMKRASDQKSMDDLKQRVMQQTGEMFTAFDKSAKSGLLEGLEDENSTLSNLPFEPIAPPPKPKTDVEIFAESVLVDDGLEGEDLPEVEELAEIADVTDTSEFEALENLPAEEETEDAWEEDDPAPEEEPEQKKEENAADLDYVVDTAMMGTVIEALEAQGVGAAENMAADGARDDAESGQQDENTAQADTAAGDTDTAQTGADEQEDTAYAEAGSAQNGVKQDTGVSADNEPGAETKELQSAIIEAELEERNAKKNRAAQREQAKNAGFDTVEMRSVADKLIENAEREIRGESDHFAPSRALTEDEKELFGALIQTDQMKSQIAAAIDKISLAAYTGNVIITGENGSGTMTLAKNLIKSVQISDRNFSGRVARISGAALDKKNIPETLSKLRGGALIVEKANGMSAESLKKLTQYLEQESEGIIVILEDTKIEMRKCLNKNPVIEENFNARIDINAMDNDALVAYARDYAYDLEYSIDDLGILALYTRISDLQTGDHSVTLAEVRDIIDEAIWSANRKNPKHFVDILSGKRYDDEDMIILREKDFIC
ncbi:MAG: hypothetical protein K2I07_15750 [Lachnospiraceae bacterium]|nr:hypothetical protein [Lachnospiraceae bacterium]